MGSSLDFLAVVRGLHVAAILSLLGVTGFIAWVLPAAAADGAMVHNQLIRLWRISGVAALLTGLVWFVLQAAAIAGAADLRQIAVALPEVAASTRFGHLLVAREALLLVATLL